MTLTDLMKSVFGTQVRWVKGSAEQADGVWGADPSRQWCAALDWRYLLLRMLRQQAQRGSARLHLLFSDPTRGGGLAARFAGVV